MHLELGAVNRPLSDGFATWDDSAADALRLWNQYLDDGVQFQAVLHSSAPIADGNRINTVSYSPNLYGRPFGDDVLAVTILTTSDEDETVFIEADTFFNSTQQWDSYRGPLRMDRVTKRFIYDFHRVAIHEFGHTLGLDHPDGRYPPSVAAIMNSRISDIDVMQQDDIAGVRALYKPIGRLMKTFALNAGRLLTDPVRPRLYATLPQDNALAVIDTETLDVITSFPVGVHPADLTISPDNARLYVANTDSRVGVVDLNALTVLPELPSPVGASAIAAGAGNRLYLLDAATPARGGLEFGLIQIDAVTGAFQGALGRDFIYAQGFLQISPDRSTLYFGDTGISAATLARFDVSTATGVLLQKYGSGANGQGLTVSHNGQFLSFPNGAGNAPNYATTLIPANDISRYLGVFATTPYPRNVAFSPDDVLLYEAGDTDGAILIFDTETFTLTNSFRLPLQKGSSGYSSRVTSMAVTSGSAGYLFIASSDGSAGAPINAGSLRAFRAASNPPRPVPSPPSISIVGDPARGGFVVSRTGDVTRAIKVHFHGGGPAIGGMDYVTLGGKLKLAAGQSEAVIPVTLLPGANRNRKVKVFLDPAPDGSSYTFTKAQAKVLLRDLP